MNDQIKVGFCVAYDWQLLRYSLPLIYQHADVICLSIDKDRISWSHNQFEVDETGFKQLIEEIDFKHKISIYEDNFHLSDLTPMQNEVRQRNCIAEYMGSGGWHIQLDTDEYFLRFEEFVRYLKTSKASLKKRTNICCAWITLFKITENGFLFMKPTSLKDTEFIPVATYQPDYKHGRRNGDFNVYAPFYMIHQSWARSEEEIYQKLTNWGHRDDFDTARYFEFWKSLNDHNYHMAVNFHPVNPPLWPHLNYSNTKSIEQFMNSIFSSFPISTWQLFIKNSKTISRIKSLF